MNRRLYTGAVLAVTAALSLSACSGSSSTSSPSSAPGTSGGTTTASAPAGGSSTAATPTSAGTTTTTDNSPARANTECDKTPDTCNTGTVTAPGTGTFAYTIEKDIQDWDLLTNAGNTFDTQEALDPIYPEAFEPQPDLKYALETDYFTSITQTSASPQTIVYKFNPKAVWSDGSPINEGDLALTWHLQSTKACGGATSQAANAPTFCDPASTSGYDNIKSITPSDNGETATLVFATPFSDWKSLFGPIMPDYIAKANGGDSTKAELSAATTYFSKTVPTWSGGPYLITKFQKATAVTEVPNTKWAGASKPGFATLVFRIITDATTEAPALQSGEVQAINPQPEVDLIKSVQSQKGVVYHEGAGLVWEHFDLNLKNKALQNKQVRLAIFTALNREALIKRTIGQFDPNVKTMDNHMFVPGQVGYQNNTPAGFGSGDATAATKILTAAGYKISGGKLIQPDGTAFPDPGRPLHRRQRHPAERDGRAGS